MFALHWAALLTLLSLFPGDIAQPDSVAPWQESLAPALEGEGDKTNAIPEEANISTSGWALKSEEIMTLGLSGEYLYPVKSEPHSVPSLHDGEEASDPTSCSPEEQTGERFYN